MEENKKIVDFYKYCQTCKYKDVKEENEPCNTCLDNPVNIHTEKPVKYEEQKNKNNK